MYSREKVELFLLATEDGMGPTAAAKFAGVSVGAAKKWATGHLWIGNTYLDDSGRDSPASLNSTGDM
ncbi:hypothetical protein [Collinsella aerofaciens]|uniref:hypothetical protein n=1 Tax=Collinsella aerofaciens TaxID=74426 RepID=UPI001371BD00|nr:hypothetical protein [Collinsella aerofaciens]MZJ63608.1 hypothetical protein [Collinsella aerofaciens]